MATLYIFEASAISIPGAALPALPALAEQAITISGVSAQSAALNAQTRYVVLSSDTACHITAGSNPAATATNFLLPANTLFGFSVTPGNKIAAIT